MTSAGFCTNRIDEIVIVGGGTSGWMSASFLTKLYPDAAITVIEAPAIPRMGVGEATIPNLDRAFWRRIGIPETEWMPRVRATCKMGIKFANWSQPVAQNPDDYYWHLFGVMPSHAGVPLPHYWNERRLSGQTDARFDQECFRESAVAERQLSPVDLDGRRWSHYAWHFDANLMAEYLKELSIDWGVRLVAERVVGGSLDSEGNIAAVTTDSGRKIGGDLFIDCTGFRATLIGDLIDEPYLDSSDELLCDAAVATQLPEAVDVDQLDSYTTATALDSGWSWHIPLLGRVGAGYVYSSQYCTEEEAIAEFSAHLGVDAEATTWNRLRFGVGRRERAWVNNCIAIGLAANFLEPLESTALYMTYGALHQLGRFMPEPDLGLADRDAFNAEVAYSYDDCKDFVQMHYVCSPRDDTPFWRANNRTPVPDSLQAKLDRYRNGEVINLTTTSTETYYDDFDYEFRNFWTEGSYYAVLTGMGVFPERSSDTLPPTMDGAARDAMFATVAAEAAVAVASLPTHRDYLVALYEEASVENGELVIDLRDR